MKKFFKHFLMTVALLFTLSFANAQTAIETSKLTDNISVSAHAGLTGPISYENLFPLNTAFGVAVGKQVTPILGFNLEGTTWFGSNASKPYTNRFDSYIGHNVFRALNLGLNGTLNFTNMFSGYKGIPRHFEYGIEGGIGWLHLMRPNADNGNEISAKTQFNFLINLGAKRAHTIGISPVVFWNLTENTHGIKFNRHNAQWGAMVSYTYHLKNSNGKHYMKMYDIAAYENAIKALTEQNEELKDAAAKPNVEIVKIPAPAQIEVVEVPSATVVYFAVNDATIDEVGKAELDKIPAGANVDIVGTASPEGTEARNTELSKMRANAVAEYLKANGVNVQSVEGRGATLGSTSNRVAIVKAVQ